MIMIYMIDKVADLEKRVKKLEKKIDTLNCGQKNDNTKGKFMIGNIELVIDATVPSNKVYLTSDTLEEITGILGLDFHARE